MGELVPIIIVLTVFGAPVIFALIVLHYLTRWREIKSLSADDERLLEDLWRTAQAMEKRIETLETILEQDGDNRDG